MQILTWNPISNDGALQIQTKYGQVFSDYILVKPVLSFDFNELYYNECDNRFLVDGEVMTGVQKAEIQAVLKLITPPLEWVKLVKGDVYNAYMTQTSWYIERFNDPSSGKPVPEEVLTKRAICRKQLSLIKECTTIDQLDALAGVVL